MVMAVNIDMALTATIAENRGYITVEDRDRILGLMSRIGFSPYHPLLDSDLLWYGTQSITMTRMVCKSRNAKTNRRMLCQRFDS